jgi:homoserine kinase
MSKRQHATAFAPASIGNVGVGFDMLGLAIAGPGDRVTVRRVEQRRVTVAEVRGLDGEIHPYLSTDANHNTASIAAAALWHDHGNGGGLEIVVHKGVPLQSGMGSSAASAVAAVVAANALLDRSLPAMDLLSYAIRGEQYASKGLHADNVAPSLLGGLVFCPMALLPGTVSITPPAGISSVLLHPELQVNTAHARQGLARSYSMEQWLTQQAYLGGFIAACERDDPALLARCLHDVIIEPQRAVAVPCFADVKRAAMTSGALGCSLSGSGPSIFALCANDDAPNIATAMEQQCRNHGYDCQSWISPLDCDGARVDESG